MNYHEYLTDVTCLYQGLLSVIPLTWTEVRLA
jgi:hypothetical protein